ncbi:nudix hydrolase 8 [Coffea arabica]|uniref:Nudix hydrolase 8 n=1 Tax=Coffea arabica TaxID=13443 RepID=A0A6P6TPP2_COFAR|nr:nudix hydrolase 8 isoform X1 [Coffea arabica]XP_027079972.1 nudix hydrolase 8 isoform X1 [Coffea arabica]
MQFKPSAVKSVPMSKMVGTEMMFSTSFINPGRMAGCREVIMQSFSCRVTYPKASYSSISHNTIRSVGEEILFESFPYRVNGTNSSSMYYEDARVLDAFDDEYNGVIVHSEGLPSNPTSFASILRSSLSHWKAKGKKGVWLKLPITKSEFVPIAVKEGFQYHHAESEYVMMTYWIPEEPCLLPSNASHQVGVGSFVINENNEVLVVQEKYSPTGLAGLWKIPTGFILESEEIFTGAVREVKEETGVDSEFVEVIAFRHAHNVAFEKSDLFFICMLRSLSTQIMVDDHEIQAAKWMPLVEFVKQPLIQEDTMFKKITDICIARMGKRYCGLAVHQLASKFDGRLSSLYFNIVEDANSTCQTS